MGKTGHMTGGHLDPVQHTSESFKCFKGQNLY